VNDAPASTSCTDNNACTNGDACDGGGACISGAPVVCQACELCDTGTGCTAAIDQSTFFPQSLPPPQASLSAPPGYVATEAMLALPGLGTVHAVRLDNPASETVIVYSGGNGSFVSALSPYAAALADATGADLILYDYPGRGGTDIAPTIDASIATGPALLQELRRRGWIGRGEKLGDADAFTARILLIHHYRRVVLRDPLLPAPLLPRDWPGRAARQLCGEIYRGLLPASEQWLDAHASNETGPLPKPDRALARRFDGT
jgi:hypothetical protein